ncbi:peptide ligase PGM1-related protein [Stappia sediminis]|nr:peptide ligase PGM1-related protein [Stappia sediminis]
MDPDASKLDEERAAFDRLQKKFAGQYRRVFSDPLHPRTIVVLPSLTLDQNVLSGISGVHHYEERMLCLLLLLKFPKARVIYLSSQPIADEIIDYYLHLLPGVPHRHAAKRLTLFPCHDVSSRPLTTKILERPRLLSRIKGLIDDPATTHMVCFNVSPLERRLAVELGIPIYGCDPDLLPIGSKSGGRKLFREAGVTIPDGFEDLRDAKDVSVALAELKARYPAMRKAVVKLNEGFSGEGNALFNFDHLSQGAGLSRSIEEQLHTLKFEAGSMNWETYSGKIGEMGAIVEVFIGGRDKRSPSCQFRIDPLGALNFISTHDQVLGGSGGQVFLGCTFPADPAYCASLQEEGLKAAKALKDKGVLGRFGVDFITQRHGDTWTHHAIEINLRKGGTTHPFTMLQFLTAGHYDTDQGQYFTPDGRSRFYYATDNLESSNYRGLTPEDLIDFSVRNGFHFDGATQRGIVFHLIGALSEFGKLGAICIAESAPQAVDLYRDMVSRLEHENTANDENANSPAS